MSAWQFAACPHPLPVLLGFVAGASDPACPLSARARVTFWGPRPFRGAGSAESSLCVSVPASPCRFAAGPVGGSQT